jgi:hypothetical protein
MYSGCWLTGGEAVRRSLVFSTRPSTLLHACSDTPALLVSALTAADGDGFTALHWAVGDEPGRDRHRDDAARKATVQVRKHELDDCGLRSVCCSGARKR